MPQSQHPLPPETVELHAGSTSLTVIPAIGGSITRYASRHDGTTFEWLRPASPEAIRDRAPLGMSCFPLVPFSSRVRNATFHFRGRTVTLPTNFLPEPHAIHGHGWQAPWDVIARSENDLTLEYRHPADAWPWPYRAEQRFLLNPEALAVRLAFTNEGSESMPVGLGFHPYFMRTPGTRVRTGVGRMWRRSGAGISGVVAGGKCLRNIGVDSVRR